MRDRLKLEFYVRLNERNELVFVGDVINENGPTGLTIESESFESVLHWLKATILQMQKPQKPVLSVVKD